MIRERIDAQGHPIIIIAQILRRYGQALRLNFSRYQIGPPRDQFSRPRTVFSICAADVTVTRLESEIQELKRDEELALHSKAVLNDEFVHIPMVDFDKELSLEALRTLGRKAICHCRLHTPLLEPKKLSCLYSFKTGRSYHQYADALMLESDWCGFLGELLLLNSATSRPSVDTRWIGHALKRGYTALRWSHNTARYVAMPTLVDKFDANQTNSASMK